MKCPVCSDTELAMSTRQNIEIDYCPKCRGVWLDRGELDKLIERSTEDLSAQTRASESPAPVQGYPQRHHDESRRHDSKYKRKSFWHEIFD